MKQRIEMNTAENMKERELDEWKQVENMWDKNLSKIENEAKNRMEETLSRLRNTKIMTNDVYEKKNLII